MEVMKMKVGCVHLLWTNKQPRNSLIGWLGLLKNYTIRINSKKSQSNLERGCVRDDAFSPNVTLRLPTHSPNLPFAVRHLDSQYPTVYVVSCTHPTHHWTTSRSSYNCYFSQYTLVINGETDRQTDKTDNKFNLYRSLRTLWRSDVT